MQRIMVLLLPFLVFSCLVHASPTNVSLDQDIEQAERLTGRIVNGTKAILRQFPHQVSLMRSWSQSHFCGGSIISNDLVLTAAHCLYDPNSGSAIQPWTIMVFGGDVKLNAASSTVQRRGVQEITIHPDFQPRTLENDIAVLKLSQPFEFTPELHNVPLPTSHPVPETLCQVSGWGYPEHDIRIVSKDLMYVDIPIRERRECRELLVNVTRLPPGMFCAGYLAGGRDACQGDSGGGMVCDGILTGVVSGGKGCAFPRLPGVYSDIYYYRNWISNGTYITFMRKPNRIVCNSSEHKTPTIAVIILSLFFALISITSRL